MCYILQITKNCIERFSKVSVKKQQTFIPAVRLVSLGCVKNFVDTEIASASLVLSGFSLTDDDDAADVMYINTCAFLASARKEAEKTIRAAAVWKRERSGRVLVVAGCLVEYDAAGEYRSRFKSVDAWLPVHAQSELGMILRGIYDGAVYETPAVRKFTIPGADVPRIQLTPPHYAYLRISDGCDNRCAYCLIPEIRGGLRSRTQADVVAEARGLLANGVRELIVISQDTGAFGRDRAGSGETLATLLDALDGLDGDYILRLMYIHPASVTDELVSALKRSRHLVRTLEMPLQHIADGVLAAMGRKQTSAEARAVVKRLQDSGYSIRTTFMTGFPGETEQDFAELLDFVRQTRFLRLGVFRFSPEQGTPAAELKNTVDPRVAGKRQTILMKAQAEISLALNESLVGQTVDVILDTAPVRGRACGRTYADAPEIDNLVQIHGLRGKFAAGDVVKVLIETASEYEIQGKGV